MVNRLYLTKGWTTANWYGNGGGTDGLIYHVPSGLTAQFNGSISYINPGDVITLNYGTFGHAGIIDSISGGTYPYNILNQNADLTSSAKVSSGSLSGGNATLQMNAWAGYTVQGVVHHQSGNTGTPTLTPAGISFNGALNVFKVGGDNQVYNQYWNGSSWSGWAGLGGNMVSNPAVIVNGTALNVFARGVDGQIYTEYNGGSGWSGWASLGSHQMKGNPTVMFYGTSLNVFALDTNNVPYEDTWTSANGWTGWNSLGNYMASDPAAASFGGNLYLVFRGGDNHDYENVFNGTSWSGWSSRSGGVSGNPSVLNYAGGELDIWFNTSVNQIWKTAYNGSSWSSWTNMGSSYVGDPYIMQYGNDLEVYARGTNNQIYTRYWSSSGQTWSGWASLGGTMASDPYALQYGSELDVFASSTDTTAYKDTFTPTNGWGGFSALN
jgi:hypothetical protein